MPHDVTAPTRRTGHDDHAHGDGLLMHELTVLNTMIERYVVRYADAAAGYDEPISLSDEHALADRVSRAGAAIRARVIRRAKHQP